MRFTNIQFLEGERVTVSIHNLNASKTILDGQVVFALSYDQLSTNNAATPPTSLLHSLGVDVMTANDAAGSTTNSGGLVAGVAKVNPTTTNISTTGQASIPVGGVGEAVCFGFTDAIVQTRTRATSTDSWASTGSLAAGDQVIPETINNNLKWQGSLALSAGRVAFVLAQSLASIASQASNYASNGASLYEATRMKVRVSCM